ncbi:hypothetical protein OPV22_028440 [Ensete ventricosum]|uniref:Pentacotripeptide-repeat region of PRORP domain-containing protein n=1 Tax=Ensete ventricosum TaxID=4639 RepID=A0AAV8Q8D7_ENSVE|nr:hypothetical protein OPV22_028440 [Ensete ventricosum]
MEGSLSSSRPAFPTQTTKTPRKSSTNHQNFNLSLPPPPPPPSHSLPLDSLLHHLQHLTQETPTTVHPPQPTNKNPTFPSLRLASTTIHREKAPPASRPRLAVSENGVLFLRDPRLGFLSGAGKSLLRSIVEQPPHDLVPLLESKKDEIFRVDWVSLLKALEILGNWEKALALFEWAGSGSNAEGSRLDAPAIEVIIRALGRHSQHSIASKLFDSIPLEEYCLDIRAYTTLLHAYSRTGKFHKAVALFKQIKAKGLSPTLVTYNVILDVYGRMGRSWSKILEILDEMKSRNVGIDEFTCSTVISACAREGLLEEASMFFEQLKRQGYVPGTVAYNSLLQVYGKAGNYPAVMGVLKEMEDNNCPADAVTYNELVATYARAGFYEEGAAVLDTMTSKGIMPNSVTYSTVISGYGKAGKEDEALALFDQMKKLGCVPNACTYNTMLGMLGKKSRTGEMLDILTDMKSNGCVPNRVTWNTMLAMCAKRGMENYVSQVFDQMKKSGVEPDRDSFNTLIAAYGRCGSSTQALQMYDEMVKAGFSPCTTTYNALLNAISRKGDWIAAESVILHMKKKGFKPNELSYSLLLQTYAKGRHIKGIQAIEEKVYDEKIFPSWVILRTLIIVNLTCRMLNGMEKAFEELKRHGYKPDLVGLRPDLITHNNMMNMIIVDGYCKAKRYEEAMEFVSGILNMDSSFPQQSVNKLTLRVEENKSRQ